MLVDVDHGVVDMVVVNDVVHNPWCDILDQDDHFDHNMYTLSLEW
jgi:hypothetical protein